ncbi:DUF3971 domain-containing protein [Pseudochelatococcus sp. G4_1912]|uniref:YhdP family protein n=1 Tax=Pseudochelatococcus sp. G4_1912 TaxID=3114288 RepID=UPI0039C6E189
MATVRGMVTQRQLDNKRHAFALKRPGRRHGIARRVTDSLLRASLWLLLIIAVCAGGIALRMSFGPVSAQMLAEPIAKALTDRLSPGWTARIANTGVAISDFGPALLADNIEILQPDGTLFLQARAGEIALNPWQLLYGDIHVTSIAFSGIDARLTMMPDGSIRAGDDATAPILPSDDTSAPPVQFDEAVIGVANLLSDPAGLTRTLDSVSLSEARLTFVDTHGSVRAVFTDVAADLIKTGPDERAMTVGLKGAANRWTINGSIKGTRGLQRDITLTLAQAPLADLLMLSGAQDPPITGDIAFSSQIHLTISPEETLTSLKGAVEGSHGTLLYQDRDQPPLDVTTLRLEAERDNVSGDLIIPSFVLHVSDAKFALNGRVRFSDPTHNWHLQLDSSSAVLPPLSPAETPLTIDKLSLAFIGMTGGGVKVERVAASGAGFGLALNGELGGPNRKGSVRLGIQTARSNARAILRFWPAFVTPEPRHYLIENLSEGVIESLNIAVDLTSEQLAASRRREPLPADSVRTQFSAIDVTLQAAPGFPPLTDASIAGVITGNSGALTASTAIAEIIPGEELTLSEGRMSISRLTAPIDSTIDFRLQGSASTLARLLQRDALRHIFNFDIAPETIQGEADLNVSLALPLIKNLRADQVVTRASGQLRNLAIDLETGKDRLTDGDLAIKLDAKNFTLAGNGQLGGLPAEINLLQPLRKSEGPAKADIILTLDDAARAKRGINLGKHLTGPITAQISTTLGKDIAGKNTPLKVEVDLARARIDQLVPGWVKAAGKPGRITFSAIDDNGYALSNIVLDAGASARGSAQFDPQGDFRSASLTGVKLSPNDDFALDINNNKGIYHISVKGNLLDARPFLRLVRDGSTGSVSGDGASALNLDVAVAVNILAGFNGESLSKAALTLALRKNTLDSMRLSGSFSGAALQAEVAQNNRNVVVLQSNDAGAALRFADIYSYMAGGIMNMHVALTDGGAGLIMIRDFAIRNEPTMSRILTESPKKFSVDPGNVPFTKMRVKFTRSPGRINIQEGVLWGPGVGVTLEGNLDTQNETIDVSGTYVPAYALNNIFSQVPILGPLLGGGQYEGLFAINFRAQGPFASPSLSINPLSAIAPGIFRKFFDLGRADSGQ